MVYWNIIIFQCIFYLLHKISFIRYIYAKFLIILTSCLSNLEDFQGIIAKTWPEYNTAYCWVRPYFWQEQSRIICYHLKLFNKLLCDYTKMIRNLRLSIVDYLEYYITRYGNMSQLILVFSYYSQTIKLRSYYIFYNI